MSWIKCEISNSSITYSCGIEKFHLGNKISGTSSYPANSVPSVEFPNPTLRLGKNCIYAYLE